MKQKRFRCRWIPLQTKPKPERMIVASTSKEARDELAELIQPKPEKGYWDCREIEEYALFDKDFPAEQKYDVTTPPSITFHTRKAAENYIKKHNLKHTKVLRY